LTLSVFRDSPFQDVHDKLASLTGSRIPDKFSRLSLWWDADGTTDPTESDVKCCIDGEFSKYFSPKLVAGKMMINYTVAESWYAKVKTRIPEKAGGTFSWIGLAMRQIRHAWPPNLKRILQSLPTGLNAMYGQIVAPMQED
jgi:hypothetical protein